MRSRRLRALRAISERDGLSRGRVSRNSLDFVLYTGPGALHRVEHKRLIKFHK
jgi:hypothetical protein